MNALYMWLLAVLALFAGCSDSREGMVVYALVTHEYGPASAIQVSSYMLLPAPRSETAATGVRASSAVTAGEHTQVVYVNPGKCSFGVYLTQSDGSTLRLYYASTDPHDTDFDACAKMKPGGKVNVAAYFTVYTTPEGQTGRKLESYRWGVGAEPRFRFTGGG